MTRAHQQLALPMGEAARGDRELVLASAGSGKTFRISTRLIALLAAGERPDAVFASTFTRKAAGEILDRVLLRLADATASPEAAADLASHCGIAADVRKDFGPRFWAGILETTARQLHRLNIGTLDAFFVRAAGSFAMDLGLPAGWRIADDAAQDLLAERVLQDIFGAAEPDAVVQLVRALAGGLASRSVHQALMRRVAGLMKVYHAIDPAAGEVWSAFRQLADRSTPARRDDLSERIAAAPVPGTRSGAPDGRWAAAVRRTADAVRAGDWVALMEKGLGARALNGASYYSAPFPEELRDLVLEACVVARGDLAARYHDQCTALDAFTRLFDATMARRRRETGLYGFDDVTRLVGGDAPLTARDDLFYRLDARTRHVLLDEFQDTSTAQWEALAPLVEELLAGSEDGRSLAVVADPKQSIYGWRGGAPELVDMLQSRHGIVPDRLTTSWRSSPVILDVVNHLFGALPSLPIWDTDTDAAQVLPRWLASFSTHTAAKPELGGHVRVVAGPADATPGEARPNLCRHAAELVATLYEEVPGRSIGVLTRRNVTVARMMFELKRLGIPASEEGGNPLTDAAPVTSLLALLRLADHPGNTVARYHVARTPVGAALGYADHGDDAATRRLAAGIRRRLVQDGYGRTFAWLADGVRHACDGREARRVAQLVELAWRYDSEATLRPSDFVHWVRAQRVEDHVEARVRVMTVHQAKGLEFDLVVLPELDAPLTRNGAGEPLACRPTPAGRVTKVFPYVPAGLMPLFSSVPELEQAAAQARAADLRDALSMLYVAMTRARHALHIVVKPDGRSGPGTARTAARIIREALAPGLPSVGEGEVLFEAGDPAWFHAAAAAATAQPDLPVTATDAAGPPPLALRLRRDAPRTRALPRRTPSQLEGGDRVDLSFVLRLGAAGARDRGSIVHLWLEQVGWVEDGLPADEELLRLAREVDPDITAPAALELAAAFREWIAAPAVNRVLSRGAWPGAARVEREVPFMHRDADALLEGIIDRLVTVRQHGRVVTAHIIDYKTDAVGSEPPDVLAARRDHYAPQLQAYRRAVSHMYRLALDAVDASLVFLEAGAVLPVADSEPAGAS